jgi:hypothetical protein
MAISPMLIPFRENGPQGRNFGLWEDPRYFLGGLPGGRRVLR